MILYIVLFSAFAWSTTKCEPPVNSYLPPSTGNTGSPSSQYGPPGRGNGRAGDTMIAGNQRQNQPQDSYSPPGRSDSSRPLDTQYGPPSSGRGTGQGTSRPSQFSSPSQRDFQGPRDNNEPNKQYGVPGGGRGQGNGPQDQAGQSPPPFNRPQGRPPTSYDAPRGQGFGNSEPSGGRNGFGSGGSGFGQRPDSSYGPPPSGDVRPGNGRQLNQGSQAEPGSSFSAPIRDAGANSYDGEPPLSGSLSSSYGTPGFSNGPGGRGSGDSGSGFGDESGEPAKYEFNYDVDDAQSGTKFGHSEQRDGDTATGQYNVELPDGRKQVVEYEAGLQGYKPMIRYEGGRNGAGSFGNGNSGPQNNDIGYPESGQGGRPGKNQQGEDFNQGGPGLSDGDFMGYPRGGPDGAGGPGQSRSEGQPRFPPGNGDNGLESHNGGARGGRPFSSGQNGDSEGYPRGGPQGNNGNYSPGNDRPFSNEPGARRGQSSKGGNGRNNGDEGYPRGGPNGSSRTNGNEGYPQGGPNGNSRNNGDEGYPRGGPNGNSRNNGDEGYPRGGPNGNSRNNGDEGYQRGGANGNSRNNGDEGYSRGGPNGNSRNNDDEGYPRGGPSGPRGSGY